MVQLTDEDIMFTDEDVVVVIPDLEPLKRAVLGGNYNKDMGAQRWDGMILFAHQETADTIYNKTKIEWTEIENKSDLKKAIVFNFISNVYAAVPNRTAETIAASKWYGSKYNNFMVDFVPIVQNISREAGITGYVIVQG
jgi:hypothetical protein